MIAFKDAASMVRLTVAGEDLSPFAAVAYAIVFPVPSRNFLLSYLNRSSPQLDARKLGATAMVS